jgi:hypothetical protein
LGSCAILASRNAAESQDRAETPRAHEETLCAARRYSGALSVGEAGAHFDGAVAAAIEKAVLGAGVAGVNQTLL